MAVIETIYDLHNHADKKGFSRVHIMSIKPIFLKLSEGIESVVTDCFSCNTSILNRWYY
jgi:hypothetical protein